MKRGIRDGVKAFLEVSEIPVVYHQQALRFPLGLSDAHNPHSLMGNTPPTPKSARLFLLQLDWAKRAFMGSTIRPSFSAMILHMPIAAQLQISMT